MRGIDVIEALQDIDETLILRAKRHKKYAPAWLRYVSVAACICCALLLGLLVLNRLMGPGEENVPDVLAPTEEEIGTSAPEVDTSVTPEENNPPDTENVTDFGTELFSFGSSYAIEENRINNLQLACDAISGTILQPGDIFSFNDVVGERTAEKGYKVATVSTTGDDEPVVGGGISQVSSTLYFCCLYADLEILERHGHVFQPSWVPAGRDAAVYWNSQDFRFRNSTAYPIRIDASLSDGRVYITLMSTVDDEKYVEIDTSSTTTEDHVTYYLTRHIYDMDGNLLRTDTTEDLDAMGGLGSTTYAVWQNTTVEEPSAEVSEYPSFVVTENQLVDSAGIAFGMNRTDIISILGEPDVDTSGNTFLRYGGTHYDLTLCNSCGDLHLSGMGSDGSSEITMPFGFSYDTALEDVLSYFDAANATPAPGYELYHQDDNHYALYAPLANTGLMNIQIIAGDLSCEITFGRNNTIVSHNIRYLDVTPPCPHQ